MSETEVRPAVIVAMTFAEKVLQGRPASCAIPFLEGLTNETFSQVWTTKSSKKLAVEITAGEASFSMKSTKFYFQNGLSSYLTDFGFVCHMMFVVYLILP